VKNGLRIPSRLIASALALCLAGSGAGSAGAPPAGETPGDGWLAHVEWVNHAPLRAPDLRGHVVVVEFWTFECINCRRTVPAMRKLSETFAGSGVVILGLHSPELDQERVRANVVEAVKRCQLDYPIAQDNEFAAWRAFGNQYWPALYVMDGMGRVRARHIGELHLGTPEWDSLVGTIRALARSHS
jgi:thiol-disulfide isomerase/thioredoxin